MIPVPRPRSLPGSAPPLPKGALVLAALSLAALASQAGCAKEGCLAGDDPDCVVPSPCASLDFGCQGSGSVEVKVVESLDDVPSGTAANAALGDILLRNDQVYAVIDALDHPHFLAPTGGSIVDLGRVGRPDGSLNNLFQAVGLLPDDAAYYDTVKTLTGDGFAAVQLNGHLDGRPDLKIATRYEVRACEPGVRIRTEVVNMEPEPRSWFLTDAWYWGGRGKLAFTPSPGAGFLHPSFGLSDVLDAFRDVPFMAAGHAGDEVSYSVVACNREQLAGFQSEDVSAMGTPVRVSMPRDYEVFERFVAVSEGPSISGAADLALDVRKRLWGEEYAVLTGRVAAEGSTAPLPPGLGAAVLVSEGTAATPDGERIPWTHALPAADGSFAVRVPAGRDYVVEVESYGRAVAEAEVQVGADGADAGTLSIPSVGRLEVSATVDGVPDLVLAFVRPADDATHEAVRGQMYGAFDECAPLLGNPHTGSPACDRLLVDGAAGVEVPAGVYDVFGTVGPFATLALAPAVEIAPGGVAQAALDLHTLPLQPEGTLSADFHVHGGASFDSVVPDEDRVRAFLAARMEVIAATDHDVMGNYAAAMESLSASDRLHLEVGVETTGHVLWKMYPDAPYPQVIGHWNFWPVPFDPVGPWRGAAWDEKVHPGELFTRMADAGWPADTGVAQLNHPVSELDFGRDYGYGSALGIDATLPLPTEFDGTAQSLFLYQPEGSDFANSDYHAQEVMNGTNNDRLLSYRAFWFYLLNQGVLRAGTANSDSHGLTDNVLGTPRNLVWTDSTLASFDSVEFNAAVRQGRMIGTNGPVIQASTTDAAGGERGPSLDAFTPAADARLRIRVDAAPWIPVEEVRIVVDGEVVRTLTTELSHPQDPFGTDGLARLDAEIPLSELLPGDRDSWLVVEAGWPLQPNADLDCDGMPDTGDNNGDGAIDWRDVEDLEEEPGEACYDSSGPLAEPPAPESRDEPLAWFRAAVPGGYPAAFTNPLVLDVDGDGFEEVGP